jgi:uncharacterized protein YjbI with pentapeptide repeats/DNA-binding XRE family transcriptional regulator
MQTSVNIGNKIAAARKMKNWSQAELARRMVVTSQSVGKWERGESMPEVITFVRLAEVLGVPLDYFGKDGEISVSGNSAKETLGERLKRRNRGWNMSGAVWKDSDFSGLDGLGDKFSGSNIQNCKFIGSDLSGLTLHGNHIVDTDFSEANLQGSRLGGCHIERTSFRASDLSGSTHTGSSLVDCTLDDADLTDAHFRMCGLKNISTTHTTWLRTMFQKAELRDMTLSGEITDCAFDELSVKRTVFKDLTLRNTFFKNCNLKKLQFENCQADNISLAFLKNSKANIKGITLIIE